MPHRPPLPNALRAPGLGRFSGRAGDHRGDAPDAPAASPLAEPLAHAYQTVRRFTHCLTDPLPIEDQVVQTIEAVSPTKWHLAHTSWFFERFILHEHVPGYEPYHPAYYYLFNSYYNGAGPQHCRASRGLICRPTVDQVRTYRAHIDQCMLEVICSADDATLAALRPLIVLGLNHEQQHQELILTDLKHVYSSNPLMPALPAVSGQRSEMGTLNARPERISGGEGRDRPANWRHFPAGLYEIGASGESFCFDNETPRHKVYLHPFAIAEAPVTNGEYLAFLEDGGYERPELWLSLGFDTLERESWRMPLYWYRDGERWMQYTLAGPMALAFDEPVSHLSYFEAEAFARWAGCRLPREAEWELAARNQPIRGNFAESLRFHPASLAERIDGEDEDADDANETPRLRRCFGDVWQWTQSQYGPYPGYKPLEGTLGEYNGKFMCNQFVLRGGSCATPQSHIRVTYRNFFPPEARWQFTGLRLARDG